MQIKDALMSSVIHSELNNNQLERENLGVASGSVEIKTCDENTSEKIEDYPESPGYEVQNFHVARDTTTWSSVAITHTNVNNHPKHINSIINNNLSVSRLSLSSSTDSFSDYDTHELSAGSECSENSEDGSLSRPCRGIINPNYPGFQHLAPAFLSIFNEDRTDSPDLPSEFSEQELDNKINECRNNNKNIIDTTKETNEEDNNDNCDRINHFDTQKDEHKFFYKKSKFNIQQTLDAVSPSEKCLNYVKSIEQSKQGLESNNSNIDYSHNHSSVEIEVAELQSSSTERPQFAEIEDIPSDSGTGKTCEQDSETEEIVIEHIDLISEATKLSQNTPKLESRVKLLNSNLIDNSETVYYSEDLSGKEKSLPYTKLEEIDLLSSIGRDIGVNLEKYIQPIPDVVAMETIDVHSSRSFSNLVKDTIREDTNKLQDQDLTETASVDLRKKEKMARNQARRRQQSLIGQRRPEKRRVEQVDKAPGSFDVYNIETAMPKIDLDAIESHLIAAREEERRRRNDREEIRKRLAMGSDADDVRLEHGRKPSLQSRLQSGMNLQICFMNETPSDSESPSSEDISPSIKQASSFYKHNSTAARPQVLSLPPLRLNTDILDAPLDEADFFARQARLQTEARMALAQAKEMAHMQMEVERQRLTQSPITEIVRSSLEKVGVQLGEDRRRLSRVLLTELNVAQLQVVANDLHSRIAVLNEVLVEGLLRRDDLHMEQDSMLVDVEDLTRYLGAKQESLKKRQANSKKQATPGNKRTSQLHSMMMIPIIKTKLNGRSFVEFVKK
ncbi:Similar to Schip1: Schwannomin-interacting protein 1 (Mus musculus) [Cotesia congregata]|uniref:Similar to Schip1: Schwannomin-interacting protein 1 (Mus musculus) n=1 Tax=Cotesia congregata TaxID=51543 RepID=A0A8J2HGG9_COTCN|nr:Similar to Schip1: Schwannomin-interacting protein 1 (Mus musculus) [Cotesia congregata]